MYIHIKMLDDDFPERFEHACSQAEHLLAEQILKDTSPFVPFMTGSLDQRTKAEHEHMSDKAEVIDGNIIHYPGPYAKYLYYGKLMVDPNTGSSWAKAKATKVLTDKNLVFNTAYHALAQSHWMEASTAVNKDKWARIAAKAVNYYGSK